MLYGERPLQVMGACLDILLGLKAWGNNRALAPQRVDVSQAAATLAVVLHLPTHPFFVWDRLPATNIFLVNYSHSGEWQAQLEMALQEKAPDGGLWNGPKVGDWLTEIF